MVGEQRAIVAPTPGTTRDAVDATPAREGGVDLSPLVVQTDNGSDFGGNWNRRHGLPPFTRLVQQKWHCRQHRFSPPHRSTSNSDVETVHGLMEPEFYDLVRFAGTLAAFLRQAYSFQLYFNLILRQHSSWKYSGVRSQDVLWCRAPRRALKLVSVLPWVFQVQGHPEV